LPNQSQEVKEAVQNSPSYVKLTDSTSFTTLQERLEMGYSPTKSCPDGGS
jgi:hypothetical protein